MRLQSTAVSRRRWRNANHSRLFEIRWFEFLKRGATSVDRSVSLAPSATGPNRLLAWIALAAVLSAGSLQAAENAQIYRWVDVKGRVHFGDVMPVTADGRRIPAGPQLEVRTQHMPSVSRVQDAPGSDATTREVVVYTTAWCRVCRAAKSHMAQRGVRFREEDIERSSQARRAFNRLGGRGVPLIVMGDTKMEGFEAARFNALYGEFALALASSR